jgi:hypothetical protein
MSDAIGHAMNGLLAAIILDAALRAQWAGQRWLKMSAKGVKGGC